MPAVLHHDLNFLFFLHTQLQFVYFCSYQSSASLIYHPFSVFWSTCSWMTNTVILVCAGPALIKQLSCPFAASDYSNKHGDECKLHPWEALMTNQCHSDVAIRLGEMAKWWSVTPPCHSDSSSSEPGLVSWPVVRIEAVDWLCFKMNDSDAAFCNTSSFRGNIKCESLITLMGLSRWSI